MTSNRFGFPCLSLRCSGADATPRPGVQEKASLRSQITAQVTMLSARNAEKESLRDEVENLKQDIGHLENELDQHEKARARSERSLSSSGEDKSREQLEKVRPPFLTSLLCMRLLIYYDGHVGERRVPGPRFGPCAPSRGA